MVTYMQCCRERGREKHKAEQRQEHDLRARGLLFRAKADSRRPDPNKIKAIKEMGPTYSKAELETILGMVSYLRDHISTQV